MGAARIVLVLLTAGASACVSQPASTGTEQAESVAVTAVLPAGDAAAGRKAFLDLRCTACHAVPSEAEFPKPVSANPGPPVDARLAAKDFSYLATAIASPSHQLSLDTSPAVRAHIEGVLSPMGDFTQAMTVRQFMDLHAFIRSVK
jgi:hypothetical protein